MGTYIVWFAVLWFKGPCFDVRAVSMASDSSDDESAAPGADSHLPFVTAFGEAKGLKDAPWFGMMTCFVLQNQDWLYRIYMGISTLDTYQKYSSSL